MKKSNTNLPYDDFEAILHENITTDRMHDDEPLLKKNYWLFVGNMRNKPECMDKYMNNKNDMKYRDNHKNTVFVAGTFSMNSYCK